MPSWLKIKKQLIVFSLIILISSLGIFVLGTKEAKAGPCSFWPGGGSDPGTCVLVIGLGILNQVIKLSGSLLNIALNLLKQLLNWGEFIKASIVGIGWKITRDLANMFFVLILMAIAFATILRLETYGMKALLPKLIIAALLINFSLVISGVIIDFAQVITDFFLSQAGGDEFQANMMNATQAINALATRGDVSLGTGIMAMGNVFIGALLTGIFLLITFFVFAAYAFLLIIRVVALWFLLILSPIVWMFWILPATREHFSKWWTNFIKWSFFAPASAFFLFLAIFSYKSLLTTSIVEALRNNDYSNLLPSFTQPGNLLQYLLVIGILLGGLIAAQQMGIAGASGAMGVAKWFGKGAAGGVNRWLAGGAKFPRLTSGLKRLGFEKTARGVERMSRATGIRALGRAKGKIAPYVSPGVWKRGWVARREEAEREAFRLPAPALQDKLTRTFSLGEEKSDYLERTKRRERIEERQKIVTTNSEELTGGFKKAAEAGLGSKAAAYAQASAEQGDLNDLIGKIGPGYDFNAEGISKFTEEQLKPLLGEQDAYRLGHDLNKSLEKAGQWPGRVFKSQYNAKTGQTTYENLVKKYQEPSEEDPRITEGEKIALDEANKAWSRMEPQERARFTHRLGIISESKGVPPDVPPQDLGIKGHEAWIGGLPAEHAGRIPDEVIGILMFRHSDETKKLNPRLHEKLSKILTDRSSEQREGMKKMIKEVAEKDEEGREIPTSSWSLKETEPSRTVPPTEESFEEARAKSPPGAFG